MDSDITPGELSRRFDRFEKNVGDQLKEIRTEIQAQQFVHRDVLAEILKNIADDQKKQWEAIQEINEREKRRNGWVVTGLLLPVILIAILQYLQLS